MSRKRSKYASSFLKVAGASFLALSLTAYGTNDTEKNKKKSSETIKETRTAADTLVNQQRDQ